MGTSHTALVSTTVTSTTASAAIPVLDYQRGSIILPAAATSTAWTIHGSVDGTTYGVIKNSANSAIATITQAASGNYTLPSEVFSYHSIKIVPGSDESTNVRTFQFRFNAN